MNKGNMQVMAGSQGGRGVAVGVGNARPIHCFTCGGVRHVSAQCPSGYGFEFLGSGHKCGQWGHQSRHCTMQQAHVSTDEFDQAYDGYPYFPQSDYYNSYAEPNVEEHKQEQVEHESNNEASRGFFSVMVQVLDSSEELAMAARQHSVYDINLDSYCTCHMTPCFSLEQPELCLLRF